MGGLVLRWDDLQARGLRILRSICEVYVDPPSMRRGGIYIEEETLKGGLQC
jgi:hypothetical protein